MIKESINISKIETFLHSIINKKVSTNTYVGTLPNTIKSTWNDMVLIDMGSAVQDMNAYGRGTALVFLYAKPRTDGSKNVAKLSDMEKKLNSVIGSTINESYMIRRRNTYSDYDSVRKWHCNIVEIVITIV